MSSTDLQDESAGSDEAEPIIASTSALSEIETARNSPSKSKPPDIPSEVLTAVSGADIVSPPNYISDQENSKSLFEVIGPKKSEITELEDVGLKTADRDSSPKPLVSTTSVTDNTENNTKAETSKATVTSTSDCSKAGFVCTSERSVDYISKDDINIHSSTLTTFTSKFLNSTVDSSPRTLGDGDGYSSGLQDEDMVLKWDDEDEEAFTNDEANETADRPSNTPKIEEKTTNDKPNKNLDEPSVVQNLDIAQKVNDFNTLSDADVIDKHLMDEIDTQISNLDAEVNKDLGESSNGEATSDQNDTLDKITETRYVEINLDKSLEKIVIADDSVSNDNAFSMGECIEKSNIDTTNLSLDDVISDLDQFIDDTSDNEAEPIGSISSKKKNELPVTDVNADTFKPSSTQQNINDNAMDIDMNLSNDVGEQENATNIDTNTCAMEILNVSDKINVDAADVLDINLTTEGESDNYHFDERIKDSDKKHEELITEHTNMRCLHSDTLSSEPDSSVLECNDHNLKKPDVMVEIPTQELIDCANDTFDLSTNTSILSCDPNNETSLSTDTELYKDCENLNTDIQTLESIDSQGDKQEDDKLVTSNAEETEIPIGYLKISEKPLLDEEITKESQTHLEELPKPDFEHTNLSCQHKLILAENEVSKKEEHVLEDNQLSKDINQPSIKMKDSDVKDQFCKNLQASDQTTKDSDSQPLTKVLQPSTNIEQPSFKIDIPKDDEKFSKADVKPSQSLSKNEESFIDKEQPSEDNILLSTQVLAPENDDLVSKPEENLPTEELCSKPLTQLSTELPLKTTETSDLEKQSSTDKTDVLAPKTIDQPSEDEPFMAADTSDEVPDVTDSLGLLAESFRVMEDDEEQETSEHDDGDGDDEEDFDPDDESSNQMTAEHSEDSSAQHSETDLPRQNVTSIQTNMPTDTDNAQDFIDNTPEVGTPEIEKGEFNFALSGVSESDADVSMDIEDDIVCDVVEVTPETIGGEPVEDLDIVPAEENGPGDTAIKVASASVEKADTLALQPAHSSSPTAAEDAVKPTDIGGVDAVLQTLLTKEGSSEAVTQSPSKTKKLEISKAKNILSIVDLEESSSEDAIPSEVQELPKVVDAGADDVTDVRPDGVTNVNISDQIDIMSSGEVISHITTKAGEIVISGVPKPPVVHKLTRLNTSELTIKTGCTAESTLVIPEASQVNDQDKEDKTDPPMSSEVFNLDSDDEDTRSATEEPLKADTDKSSSNKCINSSCTSDTSAAYYTADPSVVAYYDSGRKRRAVVCGACAEAFAERAQSLLEGIRDFTPLLQLDMSRLRQELVEISDSDSEEEKESVESEKEKIGLETAMLLEEKLAGVFNETWEKYRMDERLKEAQDELTAEMERLENESKEVDAMFTECQLATDHLRSELYASFNPGTISLSPIVIFDTPDNVYTCTEAAVTPEARISKRRRLSSSTEMPAKRPAIPLGYTPLDNAHKDKQQDTPVAPPDGVKADDDKDISVVTLSAEAAPPDLPPPGELLRPPLRVGLQVFAMRNAFGSWLRARLVECTPKGTTPTSSQFTMCRVKFENKPNKNACKVLPARCLAYSEAATVRMTIGTRVIALFKDPQNQSRREAYYSGVVSEVPNPVNNYRYLVFFDDGYAQYVQHADTRLVCEFSPLVWEEVHPFSREFVREYLLAYPERPMVRLHTGQSLKTELNGKWWICRVVQVDASLVQVQFQEDSHMEWIYRGSTRLAPLYLELQAAERQRARPLPRNRLHNKVNMPYVEYTRSDEPGDAAARAAPPPTAAHAQQEEIRRGQRSVAKKSTGAALPPPAHAQPAPLPPPPDTVTSRVVYYTPKNAVRPHKLVPHTCGPRCRRTDVLALHDLRTYNPLAKPLLSGWERQLVRYKGLKSVMYRAPCGRRVRNMPELHRYLRATRSDMPVDLFDFAPGTHCLAEFVLNKCIIAKKDLSNGKENVPVPCVNYYDHSLPEFCSYNTERTPTEGVPLNLDPEFLCGCDCTDDCEDKSRCACWKMTLAGARTIGLEGANIGYTYKRLPEPLPSGIYECNSRCKCKSTCLNRVAQHPLQLKLQVFKTLNRGWGIRALNDVPKGAFLCVYAGNLLTDATANLDGLNEGDEYLAELDYIEVVEQMKEGYEDDIPDEDKKLDKDGSHSESSAMSSSEDEGRPSKNEIDDGDFQPGCAFGVAEFSKRLRRRRERARKDKHDAAAAPARGDDCITISDDEEVREPSRFAAQAGMGGKAFISKYQSVRALYGEDEACYIMDAKVQGNIGRYLNHSCSPNVFVQNVFVDTHDPRFPWVAFFALWPIRAGTELTWNYNYDIGSVPSKVLYCYCGAPNCRGRLL